MPSSSCAARVEDVSRDESGAWLAALHGPRVVREEALLQLHALLLSGAHFEMNRRRQALGDVPPGELAELAARAADDALAAIVSNLDSFRGTSRFLTWAYKFVLREAGMGARRRAWQGCDTILDIDDAETPRVIRDAVETSLTQEQRKVYAALVVNGMPIDVLAERMDTTRAALYETLRDARRKLRAALAVSDLV